MISLLHCRQQWKVEFQSIWSRGKDGRAVTCRQHLELSLCKKSDQHLVRLWTVNSPCGQSRALHSGSTRQSSWNDSAGDMACFFNMTMIPTTPPPSLIWPKTKFKDLGSSTATTLFFWFNTFGLLPFLAAFQQWSVLFNKDAELKTWLNEFFKSRAGDFYHQSIGKLVEHW